MLLQQRSGRQEVRAKDVVLVKASRGIQLEHVVAALQQEGRPDSLC